MKNTKAYTIKCTQFLVDANFKEIGSPIIREFSADTWDVAKGLWKMARDNNDMTKFSALKVIDIVLPEDE